MRCNDASEVPAWQRFLCSALKRFDPIIDKAFDVWVRFVDLYKVECEYCTNFRSFIIGAAAMAALTIL